MFLHIINPHVILVREKADALQAEILVSECDRYERENAYTLRQLEDQRDEQFDDGLEDINED